MGCESPQKGRLPRPYAARPAPDATGEKKAPKGLVITALEETFYSFLHSSGRSHRVRRAANHYSDVRPFGTW